MSEPSLFELSSLKYLAVLHIQGIFLALTLNNLPLLVSLSIETPLSHLVLQTFPGTCLELSELHGTSQLSFSRADLNLGNVIEATLILPPNITLFQGLKRV